MTRLASGQVFYSPTRLPKQLDDGEANSLAPIFKKQNPNDLQLANLPRHLAIIMDGNGRWAKLHGKSRFLGHKAGAEVARKILRYALAKGIPYLTLFAFSSENWRRPQHEIDGLMRLLENYLDGNSDTFLDEKRVRLTVFGNKERLPPALATKITKLEQDSRNNVGMDLGLALNYGGRAEILQATQRIARACLAGKQRVEELSEQHLAAALDTAAFPDPDLLLRTGGEKRISNFMLWQSAYTELMFTNCPWPDFDEKKLDKMLIEFTTRVRRFGTSPEAEQEKIEEQE